MERWTKVPLAILGAAWLVLLIIEKSAHLPTNDANGLLVAVYIIWALVFAEYVVRILISPTPRHYVRHRWVEPLTVLVPALAACHLMGLERVTLRCHELTLRVLGVLRHHSLARVMVGATVLLFVGAWIVLEYERRAVGANIHNYPDALWWAIVTVTTVGYGDRYPVTTGGRVVAVVLMLIGIGLIGVLTATVASVFVKEHTDSVKDDAGQRHDEISARLDRLAAVVDDLDHRVGGPGAPPPAAGTSGGD